MRKIVVAVLFSCVTVAPGLAGATGPSTEGSSIADILRQRTQDWENATRARDVDKIGQIEAEDWRSVGSDGKVWTRAMDLDGLKSGKVKHVRGILGPLDVKVLSDDVAVTQGTLTEELGPGVSDVSHARSYAYMDVFMRRGGEWVVVRSQTTRLK